MTTDYPGLLAIRALAEGYAMLVDELATAGSIDKERLRQSILQQVEFHEEHHEPELADHLRRMIVVSLR